MKHINILFSLFLFVLSLQAQTPESGKKPVDAYKKSSVVKAYKTAMKEKNYGKAKQALDDAIKKHEVAAQDPQLYQYKAYALNELIGVENRKIYLNTKPDTATYFSYIYELYSTGLMCDSIETAHVLHTPKAKHQYRYAVAQVMMPYRNNVLNAGKFYYRKKDYAKAFQYIDMYASTKIAPVFLTPKGETQVNDPDDLTDISVLAVLSAYGSNDHQGVVRYLSQSLDDKQLQSQLLEIGSKSAAALGDTLEMVRLLENGFYAYPASDYFFITLVKYYNDHALYAKALTIVLKMVELHPNHRDYWFMAGKEQMLLGDYEAALQSFNRCVELKADDAESHSALGNIYLHQAHQAYAQFDLPLSDPSYSQRKADITHLYQQACHSFEQARLFDQLHPDLWLPGLREAYFKLNMGKELRALEKEGKGK